MKNRVPTNQINEGTCFLLRGDSCLLGVSSNPGKNAIFLLHFVLCLTWVVLSGKHRLVGRLSRHAQVTFMKSHTFTITNPEA